MLKTFIVTSIVVLIIGIMCIIISNKLKESNIEYEKCIFVVDIMGCVSAILLAILIVVLPSLLIREYNSKIIKEYESKYSDALELGYSIYLDGVCIDGTKIDISYYKMTINENSKEVYLSAK